MKEIQLTMGKVALVDDADFDHLNQWKWHAKKDDGRWYAARKENRKTIRMHKQLLKDAPLVDHKNGDGLDNQRDNLRPSTCAENLYNAALHKDSTSAHKGVSRLRRKWRARIMVTGKPIFLGLFTKRVDAAVAYDQAALQHFGEFARLNFSYDAACYI